MATDGRPDSPGTRPPSPSESDGISIRSVVPSLVIDGLMPFLTYVFLTVYVPGLSQIMVLGLSAVFPTANGPASLRPSPVIQQDRSYPQSFAYRR